LYSIQFIDSWLRFYRNEIMKPMGLTSTRLLSYRDINTNRIDLFDDAWGFYPQFNDVIDILKVLKPVPDSRLTRQLIEKIRKKH